MGEIWKKNQRGSLDNLRSFSKENGCHFWRVWGKQLLCLHLITIVCYSMKSYEGGEVVLTGTQTNLQKKQTYSIQTGSVQSPTAWRWRKDRTRSKTISKHPPNINHQRNDRVLAQSRTNFSSLLPDWMLIYDWAVIITLKGCSAPEQWSVRFQEKNVFLHLSRVIRNEKASNYSINHAT